MKDDLLGGGLLHLETGGGLHLSHSKLAGVQLLPLLMQSNLTVRIGNEIAEVHRGGSLAVAGVGHMELGPFNGSARHAVHLENGQLRPLVILKQDLPIPIGVESDKLAVSVPQPGLRDGFLGNFVHAGE